MDLLLSCEEKLQSGANLRLLPEIDGFQDFFGCTCTVTIPIRQLH